MTASLAAFGAVLAGLLLPPAVVPLPSLGGLLAAVTVLAVSDPGVVPQGLLGLPGDWADEVGGGAP